MTMLFTRNLHAEGWWNHMPPGHRLDIVMNPGPLPSSRAEARPTARRIKRSHASAWIVLAAVGATGGALAVAALHDPQGMRQHLDTTLAEVKDMTGSSSTSTAPTAQAIAPETTPAPTPVQEPAAVTTTKSMVPAPSRLSDAPLPPAAEVAARGVSKTLTASPVRDVAPLAESMPKELSNSPQVMPSLPTPTQLPPLQPLTVEAPPVVQTPPPAVAPVVAPLSVPKAEEAAPPAVQAPASSVQR